MEERNILWDFIIDTLDVQRSVTISCMEDKQFTDSILGRKWVGLTNMNNKAKEQFIWGTIKIIYDHFLKGFTDNYKWLIFK